MFIMQYAIDLIYSKVLDIARGDLFMVE